MVEPVESSASGAGLPGQVAADTAPAYAEQETFGILGPVLAGIILLWVLIAAVVGQSI